MKKVPFYPMLADLRIEHGFLEGFQASPVCPVGEDSMEHDVDGGKPKN